VTRKGAIDVSFKQTVIVSEYRDKHVLSSQQIAGSSSDARSLRSQDVSQALRIALHDTYLSEGAVACISAGFCACFRLR
jgi:hypothetical protein